MGSPSAIKSGKLLLWGLSHPLGLGNGFLCTSVSPQQLFHSGITKSLSGVWEGFTSAASEPWLLGSGDGGTLHGTAGAPSKSPSKQPPMATGFAPGLPLSGEDLQVGSGGKWGNTRTTSSPSAWGYVVRSQISSCSSASFQIQASAPCVLAYTGICFGGPYHPYALVTAATMNQHSSWAVTQLHTSSAWQAGIASTVLNYSKFSFYFSSNKKCRKHPSNYPSLAY